MVGKNWKKILAVGICGLMAAGVIAGCGKQLRELRKQR